MSNNEELIYEFDNGNEVLTERYALSVERLGSMEEEHLSNEKYDKYFHFVKDFLLMVDENYRFIKDGSFDKVTMDELKVRNKKLYEDILPENYGKSYANPSFAVAEFGEEFGYDDERVGNVDGTLDEPSQRRGQGSPVVCSDGFRDDFGEDQDEEGQGQGGQSKIFVSKDFDGLGTYAGSTHGVGQRVEGQDGGDGAVHVSLQFFHDSSAPAFFCDRLDVGGGGGEHDRFHDGTEEGGAYGEQ